MSKITGLHNKWLPAMEDYFEQEPIRQFRIDYKNGDVDKLPFLSLDEADEYAREQSVLKQAYERNRKARDRFILA